MLKSFAVRVLLIASILIPTPSPGGDYDMVKGTCGDDVIFGDLGQFSGKDIVETGGLHEIMQSLDNAELMEIGSMLEGENGIERPADTADAIYGLAGNDIIFAQGGNDYIDAGSGRDMVFAGSGNDIIIHDPDDIFIDGGSGVDVLVAAPGAPSLRAMQENKSVRSIELLLVTEKDDFMNGLPGIRIDRGKAILDPSVWKAGHEGTGLYIMVSNPESKLEAGSNVVVVWER